MSFLLSRMSRTGCAASGFGPRNVHAVLRRQSQIRYVPHCLDQRVSFLSAHHKHRVFLVVAQILNRLDHFRRRFGVMAPCFDHSESRQIVEIFVAGNGSTIIKQNQPIARHFVGLGNRLEIERFETNIHAQKTESQSQTRPGILDGIDTLVDTLQIEHDRQRPALRGHTRNEFAGTGHSLQPLLVRHGQGLLKGLCNLGNFPRIHVQGSSHDSCARGKLTQNHQTPATASIGLTDGGNQSVLVGNRKLEGNEIQSISNGCHQHHIRCLHQRHALLESHPPVGCLLELNGSRPHFVDSLDLFGNFVARLDIIVSALPRGDAHLDQNNLSDPFGASLQETFHGQHLDGNAL
mmetsp:Transcript_18848/g.38807  ORF Transcript_18848/g.38807 Transcript_18848/m.38807 type:complete len:349 (+) Transcript_18848:939-1985(+)